MYVILPVMSYGLESLTLGQKNMGGSTIYPKSKENTGNILHKIDLYRKKKGKDMNKKRRK